MSISSRTFFRSRRRRRRAASRAFAHALYFGQNVPAKRPRCVSPLTGSTFQHENVRASMYGGRSLQMQLSASVDPATGITLIRARRILFDPSTIFRLWIPCISYSRSESSCAVSTAAAFRLGLTKTPTVCGASSSAPQASFSWGSALPPRSGVTWRRLLAKTNPT